jgi:hypothetical protein
VFTRNTIYRISIRSSFVIKNASRSLTAHADLCRALRGLILWAELLLAARPMYSLVGIGGYTPIGSPRERRQGAPEAFVARGLSSYARALAGIVPRAGPGGAVDREPKAQGSPRAPGRSCSRVRLSRISLPEGAREVA